MSATAVTPYQNKRVPSMPRSTSNVSMISSVSGLGRKRDEKCCEKIIIDETNKVGNL